MVTEPTHSDGGVLDVVLTHVPGVIGVRVGLSVGTSHHSVILQMLCWSILQLAHRQEVYLKNSVD